MTPIPKFDPNPLEFILVVPIRSEFNPKVPVTPACFFLAETPCDQKTLENNKVKIKVLIDFMLVYLIFRNKNVIKNHFTNCHFKTLLYIINFGQNYEL
jgi:hypothetical protein